ncbi:MAG: hypothetical protein ACRDYB_01045 [Acidimicrobiales bacterium]
MTARRLATAGACTHQSPEPPDPASAGSSLAVRCQVRLIGGESGRALAAAQGRALLALLASVGEVEVGQDEEVLP